MLGAHDDAVGFDRPAGLLRVNIHGSNDDDAFSGEMEGTRGVSAISCGIGPAVRRPSFY